MQPFMLMHSSPEWQQFEEELAKFCARHELRTSFFWYVAASLAGYMPAPDWLTPGTCKVHRELLLHECGITLEMVQEHYS